MAAPILRKPRRFAFAVTGSKAAGDDLLCSFLEAEGDARAIEAGVLWLNDRDPAPPSPCLTPLHQALLVQPLRSRAALFLTVAEGCEAADAARIVGCFALEIEALAGAARRSIEAAATPWGSGGEDVCSASRPAVLQSERGRGTSA